MAKMRKMYGAKESEAIVLMRLPTGHIQVEHWQHGRLRDYAAVTSLAKAHAWMRTLPVIWEAPGPAVALAPQSTDNCETVDYILVDEARAQDWWFDDCEGWPAEMRRFIFIADMAL